jgi:hypothetical protein
MEGFRARGNQQEFFGIAEGYADDVSLKFLNLLGEICLKTGKFCASGRK